MSLEDLFFDAVKANEVVAAHEIEKAGFPPEEAAALEKIRSRQSVAPKLFLGAYVPQRTLIGYVNATLASSTALTGESMHVHDPKGTSVCVHAVVVTEKHRRNGVARKLLKEYIGRLVDDPDIEGTRVQRVLLICHEDLIPLYTSAGFNLVGKSLVVHGPREWFEMCKEISPYASQKASSTLPSGVMDALTNRSGVRPSSRLFDSFSSSQELISSSETNKFDILCPRPGCGSVVLKAGIAKLQTRDSFELEPATQPPPAPLQPLPPPPAQVDWWLITPSPMAFENIAFSRPVPNDSSESPQIKLLACAECEMGPFGWSLIGGREFWLAISRMGYR